ncbi:MAG: 16S rRNA (cytosine(1402)-N(4))-methyltransferase RsmH [Peptoniphilaceae bacterium]|nr:16S rRNA (cytosine(1402)-N(4))-methyltransferase RsmH [Peptoniphilaceae bacterium]MDD7383581.1 16S rRNA (cytosine(1402)-N(4))-methyltransferase RsmH [Peptoniphilaceae bacterium]MDY3738753.1 16S rRNA (cytosine(1402)-N(4))-methyltransferase RsmH [Peptoniphilaceae bacterium]
MKFKHIPVLLNETIENLNIKPDGIYVDCTLGAGGHSKEILKNLKNGFLIGFDQDEEAIKAAKINLKEYKDKIIFINENFKYFDSELSKLGVDKIDGALMDIGISSYQIDNGQRGFSYMNDGILDMRMDKRIEKDARYIVNNYSIDQLQNIFSKYGEERFSRTIAKAIVKSRKIKEIKTTFELRDVVRKNIFSNEVHPEKRIFQALRIEVNDELGVLDRTIEKIADRLNKEGRLCIITFHSLEDRIVKEKFKYLNKNCICPPELPVCKCGSNHRKLKIITKKPIIASNQELKINKRSHSAKLRVAERV